MRLGSSSKLSASPRRDFLVASAASLATIAVVNGPAKAAQFEIKCGTHLGFDHPGTIRLGQMWSAIQQESGGRIRAQFFPNNILGNDTAMFSQLRLGALHFLQIAPGNFSSYVPAGDIIYLGFAYKDADEALRVMDGPLGSYICQEINAKGLQALRAFWDVGMGQVSSAVRPIHNPDEMKGYKIRVVVSKIVVDLFREIGASPTPVADNEIYTALQTHIVDGTSGPLASIETGHWYEVLKYVSMTNHQWTGLVLIANGEMWKSLPPDLQAIIDRNNTKYAMLQRKDMKSGNSDLAAKLTKQQGMTMNQVDQAPFRARLRAYYSAWANEFGAKEWALLQSSLGHNLV